MRCEKALERVRRKRATPGEAVIGSLFPHRGAHRPGGWTQNRTEQVMHFRNWTYVAVDSIASMVGRMLPNLAYVTDQPVKGRTVKACQRSLLNLAGEGFSGSTHVGDGPAVDPGSWQPDALAPSGGSFLTVGEYRSKSLSVVKPHEDLEPLENDHPLRRLIENPNPVDTSYDLFYELQMFEELCGVSYLWTVPDPDMPGRVPKELWVLPSHWVWPRTGGGKYVSYEHPHADELIEYYEVRPWGGYGASGTLFFPAREIVRTLCKSPLDKIDGYSKLWAVAEWIDSDDSLTASRWAQFQNQARPELWVELPSGYNDPNDNRIQRLEAKLRQKFAGELNYGKLIVPSPGVKLNALSFNPTEMAYFQSAEQMRDFLLAVFRVPKTAVGISGDMTYGSLLASLAGYCAYCLNIRLAKRGLDLTKHLASRWEDRTPAWSSSRYGSRAITRRVRCWYDDCVPADPQQVNSDMQTDGQFYALTPNEVRLLRGRKPYALGGNNPMVQGPGGVMPLPINVKEDLEELGTLVGQYAQAQQPQQPQQGGMEQLLGGDQRQQQVEDLGRGAAPPAEPNGQPVAKGLGPHSAACLMLDLPPWASSAAMEMGMSIAEEDLLRPESDPHITVVYGYRDSDWPGVHRAVAESGPVAVRFGETKLFRNPDADVLYVEVEGVQLSKLNRLASSVLREQERRLYTPHVTIAYLRPGSGDKYVGMGELAGRGHVFTEATFAGARGGKERVQLAPPKPEKLMDLPDVRQDDDYSCGAMIAMSVGMRFGVGPASKEEWKSALGTTREDSTSPIAIAEYLRSLGLSVEERYAMTVTQLEECVAAGKPVICPIQEYGVPSKQASFKYGHYVGVVGVDLGMVFVQDPSIDNVLEGQDADQKRGVMPIDVRTWLKVWHDEDADGNKYVRYGIVVGAGAEANGKHEEAEVGA